MAVVDFSQFDLRVDLSHSSDATLPAGVHLGNIERVSIVGGSDSNIFLGGNDDDELDACLGNHEAKGDVGNDSLSNSISSNASDGVTDVRSGDVDALLAGAGQDDLSLSVLAFPDRDGGSDDDTLSMSVLPETYQDGGEPGIAAVSGNAVTLLGREGQDFINAFLGARSDEGSTASTADIAVLLRGGSAADTL